MNDHESFDDMDSSAPLRFDMYVEDSPLDRQAEVKSFHAKGEGMALYRRERTDDYTTLAERLLWVNGWEQTTGEGEAVSKKGPMTLVVLKLVISSHDPKKSQLSRITATIEFESRKRGKYANAREPTVVAWAPFHMHEILNKTPLHSREVTKREGNATVGYSGSSLTLGKAKEGEIAWDHNEFDEAYSQSVTGETGNRSGVTWMVTRNSYQRHALQQTIYAAVLLSRESDVPYIVKFKFAVQAGALRSIQDKVERFLGMGPDKTKDFLVTPGTHIVNAEGENIMQCIDLNNLGKLRGATDNSSLIIKWGPMQQTSETEQHGAEAATASRNEGTPDCERGGLLEKRNPTPSHCTLCHGATPVPEFYSSGTNTDSMRLTSLESRQAQVEARIAAQDTAILRLQQALLSRGMQLPTA